MAFLMLLFSCLPETPVTDQVTKLDVGFFECQIQPIFDRGCAFPGCHGNPARALYLYSVSKTRAEGEDAIGQPLSDEELCSNYYRSAAFPEGKKLSQLISKPASLDGEESEYHAGNYLFSETDSEALCLQMWLEGTHVIPSHDVAPPPVCRLNWRKDIETNYPSCIPREVDCATALANAYKKRSRSL